MASSEAEVAEHNQNILYLTEDERRSEWTYTATKELLKIYDEKTDMLDTGIINTQKKMWQLTSKELGKRGFFYSPGQCENKWKALKRAYKTKFERMKKFGTHKRPCPFEYEIAEILSKRPHDTFLKSFSLHFNEIKKQENIFKTNLNEPPGFIKTEENSVESTVLGATDTHEEDEDVESSKHASETSEPTYAIIQDDNQTLTQELSELKTALVKYNKINSETLKQTNEVQKKILECLEKSVQEQKQARLVQEKSVRGQSEIVEQMKIQNELLERLMEKLT